MRGTDRFPPRVEARLAERAATFPQARQRLRAAVEKWDVYVVDALEGGWNSVVVLAKARDDDVVLKLTEEPGAAAAEAAALSWWGVDAAPRVLLHDHDLGAIVLERLVPGGEMRWDGLADTEKAVSLLEAMHRPITGDAPDLPTLAEIADRVLEEARAQARDKPGVVDPASAQMALQLLRELFADSEASSRAVLHGDAVPPNVLRSGAGLRAIDPRPCIGDRAYDLGYWSVFSGYGLDARTNAALLARELQVDEGRILAWAWALAVNRLLQIGDSDDAGHVVRCSRLRTFIAENRAEVARAT
jgi:streptomycin 6-kinase